MAKPESTYVAVLVVTKVDYEMKTDHGSRNEVAVRLDPTEIARVSIHAGSIESLQSKLGGHIALIED